MALKQLLFYPITKVFFGCVSIFDKMSHIINKQALILCFVISLLQEIWFAGSTDMAAGDDAEESVRASNHKSILARKKRKLDLRI